MEGYIDRQIESKCFKKMIVEICITDYLQIDRDMVKLYNQIEGYIDRQILRIKIDRQEVNALIKFMRQHMYILLCNNGAKGVLTKQQNFIFDKKISLKSFIGI